MAGFKTHITASTLVGSGYAAVSHFQYGVEPATAIVGGGLCSIAGILPDVDSETGHSGREVMGFAAAVVPLLLMDHLRRLQLPHDGLVLAGGCLYVIIRFGLGEILRRYTVHRGMWHSVPAALIAGLATIFICGCDNPSHRWFKACAVVLGYLVHLLLDELYSIHWHRGRFRFKRSFGTALKFWGPDVMANLAAFAKLGALIYLAVNDPTIAANGPGRGDHQPPSWEVRLPDADRSAPVERR